MKHCQLSGKSPTLKICAIFLLFISCQYNSPESQHAPQEELKQNAEAPYFSNVKIKDYTLISNSSYVYDYKGKLNWDDKKKIIGELLNYTDSLNPSKIKTTLYTSNIENKNPCIQIYANEYGQTYTLCTEALFLVNLVMLEEFGRPSPFPAFRKSYRDTSKDFIHPTEEVIRTYKEWWNQINEKKWGEAKARSEMKKMWDFWLNCYWE